jgi:hypothetical protein
LKNFKTCFALCLFFLLLGKAGSGVPVLGAEEILELPGEGIIPQTDLSALRRAGPVVVEYQVGKIEGRDQWLDCSVEIHGLSELPLENMRGVLCDFLFYPRYFKRCLGATVTENAGGRGAVFLLGIKILGFSFVTNFDCNIHERFNGTWGTAAPGVPLYSYYLTFIQRGDVSVLSGARGEWYLQRVAVAGKEYTYYRFRAASAVLSRFSLQEWIMSVFGTGEFKEFVNQLIKAAG